VRQFWFSFTAGDRIVPVYLTDELPNDLRGRTQLQQGDGLVISIRSDISREEQDDTTTHEVLHAVLWPQRLPLKREEWFVDAISKPLTRALKAMGFSWPARPGDFVKGKFK
jgi:hypothetical protein